MSKTKAPPMILVDWEDSASPATIWIHPHEIPKGPGLCQSMGFIVERTKGYLTISADRGTDEQTRQVGRVMTIPTSAIRKTRRLK